MKRIVGNEWIAGPVIGLLALAAVGVTRTGVAGAYLFALGFGTVALLIRRHQESR